MLLAEAVKAFEDQFAKVETPEPSAVAPNGKPYIVIALGVKDEGASTPLVATSEEVAVRIWLEEANKWLKDNPGDVLYWRSPPELDSEVFVPKAMRYSKKLKDVFDRRLWVVHSRLQTGELHAG